MWGKKEVEPDPQAGAPSGIGGTIDFEEAAAKVTAEQPATAQPEGAGVQQVERLIIRPEWAEGAARLLFLPPAKFIHPAYALEKEEAEVIGPKMQVFLQALVDRYERFVPEWTARLSNRFPEFTDLLGAVAICCYHKHNLVKKLRALEEAERIEKAKNVSPATLVEDPKPGRKYKTGERDETGTLII